MRPGLLIVIAACLLWGLPPAALAQANDQYFQRRGSWGQSADDQWAIKRVRIPEAWAELGDKPQPVVVAVIDTGLDWNHADIGWDNIWRNPGEIPGNGLDDDGNGFVDDIIGWDFFANSNRPWDHDGHGTFIAGLIAARTDNRIGIAGINRHARIMVVKAVNNFGHTRASHIARGIVYAVDNGARVINLSVGGARFTEVERAALDYAAKRGVLVVAAAGNEAEEVVDYSPASHPAVLAVGSTNYADERTEFSNYGAAIDLVAPSVDILSLRARRTDLALNIAGEGYVVGQNFVGRDRRYFRTSGTSFSAPLVTGAASLILSRHPELKAADLRRKLLASARDIDEPGVDRFTGYGLLDAAAAIGADPAGFISVAISGVAVGAIDGTPAAIVTGTAVAGKPATAFLELGRGENPKDWKRVAKVSPPVEDGELARIPASAFAGASEWNLRLVVTNAAGKRLETRFLIKLR